MPEITFKCTIVDYERHERFSAAVVVKKKYPVRATWHAEQNERKHAFKDRIELADVFITPISDQVRPPVHNHFVLYDWNGAGIYIVRDRQHTRLERRECSMWDLGDAFASRVLKALKELA